MKKPWLVISTLEAATFTPQSFCLFFCLLNKLLFHLNLSVFSSVYWIRIFTLYLLLFLLALSFYYNFSFSHFVLFLFLSLYLLPTCSFFLSLSLNLFFFSNSDVNWNKIGCTFLLAQSMLLHFIYGATKWIRITRYHFLDKNIFTKLSQLPRSKSNSKHYISIYCR